MKIEHRHYSSYAISHLVDNKQAALFLDPGLGKTAISLQTIKLLKQIKKSRGVLLVAPLSVVYSTWPLEIKKWSNFENLTHTILHNNLESLNSDVDIYLINPEGLANLHSYLHDHLSSGKPCPFDTLIIDESTKFKNPKIKTKNKKPTRFKYLCDMLVLFKRRYILTGTPSPRSYMDLWSQIYLLDQGKALGINFYKFRSKYFVQNEYNKYDWQLKPDAKEEIEQAIAHLVLDMKASDYLDIPEKINNIIKIELPPKAKKLYKEMEKELMIIVDDQKASASQTAIAAMKCQQIAQGKIYEDLLDDEITVSAKNRKIINIHKEKIDALKNLVDELNGKPLLIAYNFYHDLEALRSVFGKNLPYIGSGVSAKDVKRIVNQWNKKELPLLAGHPASMAHGLNMQQGGNNIVWYSLTWNLEEYLQLNARIWRQGVKGNVRIHHIVGKNTIDEPIMNRLEERANQQDSLRDALRKYRDKTIS